MTVVSNVDIGNGIIMSVESDAAVPGTAEEAGPDRIKLQEDARKPESDPGAEYDASGHLDVPEDIEKANESTFFGVILRHRSSEAFAKTKGVFPSVDAFFKSGECRQAAAVAKQWIEKHGGAAASAESLLANLKNAGFSLRKAGGLDLGYSVRGNRLFVDVLYKNSGGRMASKSLAVAGIGTSAESRAAGPAATAKPKPSVRVKVLGIEEGDPVGSAFEEKEEDEAKSGGGTGTDDDKGGAEPPASGGEEGGKDEVAPEEIEEEAKTSESYLAAVSRILKSREEAEAAVSQINDDAIDEVIGDGEGEVVEEIPAPAAPAEPPAGGAAEPVTDEEKALEAWLSTL
jgi:hypothetical protein